MAEQPDVTWLTNQMRTALRDLNKAAKLGSATAAEQASEVKEFLGQLKSGMLGVSAAVAQPMERANKAAGRNDWDGAVNALREAHDAAEGDTRETIKRNLAVAISNRGMSRAEVGGRYIETARARRGAVGGLSIEDAYRSLSSGKGGKDSGDLVGYVVALSLFAGIGALVFLFSGQESVWGRAGTAFTTFVLLLAFAGNFVASGIDLLRESVKPVKFGTPWTPVVPTCARCSSSASYTVRVGGDEKHLCHSHANELESILNRVPPDLEALQALADARRDLIEARTIDSSLEGVDSALRQIGEMMELMGVSRDATHADVLFGLSEGTSRKDRRRARKAAKQK
jgi:hypothetical protein